MRPIHELLDRIRWDPEFARASFVIGYFDRIGDRIVRVPLGKTQIPPERPDSIEVTDVEGVVQSIPLHRIREVYRDGELVWHRPVS